MIYIIFGPPRCGKTYFATTWAIEEIKKGKREVITNYPIKWGKKWSKVWDKSKIYEGIYDSFIIIDEAYLEVNSRNWAKFDQDTHTFFATNGHNNNDVIVIAQHPSRVDTVIREMCNEFLFVKKYTIPFTGFPVFFKIEGYLIEEDISRRHARGERPIYSVQYKLMRPWSVGRAYDTHYFRCDENPVTWKSWESVYQELQKNNNECAIPDNIPEALPQLETCLDSLEIPYINIEKQELYIDGLRKTNELSAFDTTF